MRVSHDQLERSLSSKLKTAYLIAGDEPLLVIEAADQVRAAVRKAGVDERLIFDVAAGFDWDSWYMTTRSLGLFASRRLIELRLASPKLGAEGGAAIAEFVKDPGDDVLLVQVGEWGKPMESLSWVEAIDHAGMVVPIRPMPISDQPRWIEARARKLGVELTDDAQMELVALVEGNLLAAHQELFKLSLLVPGQKIDAMALVDLVADSARFDVFGLFDAVIAGRGDRVRKVLAGLRAEGTDAPTLCAFLISQVIALAGADELRQSGARLQSYWPTVRVFGPKQSTYERALGRDWPQRLREAAQIDLVCKGRAAGLPWVSLERWLLRCSLPASKVARFAA